ncbi:unnamed protein product [Lepeophtheirus salmonis]|uniref:(salmon louse) hypothetical protein n=1 Tax=Lepeophtheirus salmonis TaxID=72036 RepID=A0A7R8CUE8_LEPSM|nr:unnamed protein product [Lepeophtheirus salmonis]CAF2936031.1 unnamed protein product [Lepeophtheirus salmonis]
MSRRICDIEEHLEAKLMNWLQSAGDFAIQLDKSTDVEQHSNTTRSHIFKVLDDCIVGKYNLNCANCKGITSDGTANMTGRNSRVVKRISEAAGNDVPWNHLPLISCEY